MKPLNKRKQRQRRAKAGTRKRKSFTGHVLHSNTQNKNTNKQKNITHNRSPSGGKSSLLLQLLVGIFALSSVVWLVMFSRLNSQIRYEGQLNPDLVQAISADYFNQTSRWRFAYDVKSYERYLLQRAPFLQNVDVNLGLFTDTVTVTAETLPTTLLWQSDGVQYEVNQLGYISQSTDKPEDLPVIFDAARLEYSAGQKLLPERFVQFIDSLIAALDSQDSSLYIGADLIAGESTESLLIKTQEGLNITISTKLSPQAQIDSTNDLLEQLKQQGRVGPSEYIDTRVAGRVFWK